MGDVTIARGDDPSWGVLWTQEPSQTEPDPSFERPACVHAVSAIVDGAGGHRLTDAGARLASRTGGVKKVVTVSISDLARGEPARRESPMPLPFDFLSLPKHGTDSRTVLRALQAEHARSSKPRETD
jgi:hypothetical protein